MDYDGLPPATQPLPLLDNRSNKQVLELLQILFHDLSLDDVEPWLPISDPKSQHHTQLLATLANSIMRVFPRPGPGHHTWDSEFGDLCALSLDIQARVLSKVAILYDERRTRPPEGATKTERAWLAMLFSVLGLTHAWVVEESPSLDAVDLECLEGLARRCVEVASGMMRLLGSSLTLGDDPARPAWEAMRACVEELVKFVSDVVSALDSPAFPLEVSLFTVPRIYDSNTTPEPLAIASFPVGSTHDLLVIAVESLAVLIFSLASPLSSDGFLKSSRRSTANAICDLLSQLEIRPEPKILARLLNLTVTWMQKRPHDSIGISARVWRVLNRRIQTETSPDEALWAVVDDELAKLVVLLKVDLDLSSSPDVENALVFCTNRGSKNQLRTAMCGLLATQVDLIPREALYTFQSSPFNIDDAPQTLLDLRHAIDARLQSSDSSHSASSRKRKREDSSSQVVDVHGDVVMQEMPPVDSTGLAQKQVSFERICSTVFGGRQSWLNGGLGAADESDETFQERVTNSLSIELDNIGPPGSDVWANVPCLLAHPASGKRGCPVVRSLSARTVLMFIDLCARFHETRPRGAYDSLALALKHLRLDQAARAVDGLVYEKVLIMLENGLERTERSARMAAGRAMVQFIAVRQIFPGDQQILTARPLAILVRLASEGKSSTQETALSTLGGTGRVASEFVLGQVILTHIKLLQQQNLIIKGLAYSQIIELASYLNKAPFQLLSPYFKLITPFIVGKLLTSPGILSDVCQILAFTPRDFLTYTKAPAILAAIKSSNRNIIDALAGHIEVNPGKLLLDNPEAYLPEILFMDDEAAARKAMSFLCRDVLDEYMRRRTGKSGQMNEPRLLNSCTAPLLGELVMHLGSEDQNRREKALWAIKYVAEQITMARGGRSTPGVDVASFLMLHILGTMVHINDVLQDVRGKTTIAHKNQVLRSLGAVIELVGSPCNAVSPQIMATLQTMLRISELAEATLSTWYSFIRTLSLLDASPLLGITTAAIAANWDKFSPESREWAVKILNYLVIENSRETRNHAEAAISLGHIPELRVFYKAIKKLRVNIDPLENLLVRASNENMTVATQSLAELRAHISDQRSTIEEYMNGDVFNPLLTQAMRVLFNAACREGEGCEELRTIAYECIGIIGALDPDRLELQANNQGPMIMQNFEDEDETLGFIVSLISDVLVSAFKSTTDLKYQRHLGWAIQELVKQCGFTTALLKGSAGSVPTKVRSRWRTLSQDVIETISPFLEGKFIMKPQPVTVPSFPIYDHTPTHREWIQTWTAYLISRLENPRATKIFEPFLLPIKNQDVRVAKQILPHLIVAISQSSDDSSHLLQEIVAVLKDQVDSPDAVSDPRKALSAQTVFDLMDHLSRWIRRKNQEVVRRRAELRRGRARDTSGQAAVALLEDQRVRAESLLSAIDTGLLSNAAFRCRAFARSLMSFEKEIVNRRQQNKTDAELQPLYERLHEIYASLDEPDGMEGASKMIISPSLEQQIRGHEMTGRWTSAQSCWEIKLQQQPDSLEPHVGLLRCLRNLGHNDTMMTHIHGVLSKHPTWEPYLADFFVEGAWKLGNWDVVERITANPQRQSSEIALARLLLKARQENEDEFKLALSSARNILGGTITSNGPNSYRRSYDAVLHLHLAREIESIHSAATYISELPGLEEHERSRIVLKTLTQSLDNRFKSTLPTFRVQEPVLSMRRTTFDLLTLTNLKHEVGRAWLTSSKIAIKASHYQTAYSSILQAQQNGMAFSFLQGCKLTKTLGEPLRALQDLTHSIQNIPNLVLDLTDSNVSETDPPPIAKALLLRARWMHEADRYDRNDVIQEFQKASQSAPEWEGPHFRLGQYYDECFKQMDARSQASRGPATNVFTCKNYVEAMRHGSKYIFQTMPRLLTIWLDMAQNDIIITAEQEKSRPLPPGSDNLVRPYKEIHAIMLDAISKVKPYQWFTALPQLISRVTHPNRNAFKLLSKIIARIVLAYPQQALWGVTPLVQSRNAERASRGKEILERVQSSNNNFRDTIIQSVAMVRELLAMSERDTPENEFTLSMKKHFGGLARLAPSKLIMPLQEYLTVNLPSSNTSKDLYQPFPINIPTFHKFNDEVEIMRSLQKPRKISALSEDGTQYIFLCKPKDDLRKDARLMDLNSMINKLLKKNAESRRRQLHIRTYAVVILNEECGFLEWVPNTVGYRNVVNSLYEQRGANMHAKGVTDWVQLKAKSLSDAEVYKYWTEVAMPSVPVNLHEYFITNFSEPTAWLSSRLAYTRTAAVMSMVGHILGLGDRHGENLLFDTVNGDVVHVDFNCLFERGTTFEIPETVPFRLTANMVDGFGVTGVEGAFRTACEVTMQLLRDNYGPLISVLDAFVHDPLVEWEDQKRRNERDARQARFRTDRKIDPRGRTGSNVSIGSTDIKELARNAMLPIGRKLQGLSREGRAMSVSNQVEALIKEATDPVRLGRMYVGWMAWI
ncbi:phosphatidylinositol 3- and 4-kinase [Ceratobasidium sp. AG-Ba]|nr:phosphatidylinositol 3- and 4-kinase [Ceratobasidium sp. AG-Ba]QRW01443.1 phosphatidylinositol 3- and 4-kinase [Ceratobasidium sp. AG-Ba]